MTPGIETISPIDDSVLVRRPFASDSEIESALDAARDARVAWRHVDISERAACIERFCRAFLARRDEIGEELTRQMGRPVRYAPFEVDRLVDRARTMAGLAADSLAEIRLDPIQGFTRFIRREPLGTVFVVAPWNYPYLTAVNAIVPALLAGNAVVLKHSAQTPLCAERFAEAFSEAGLPEGLFRALHLSHADTERAIRDPRIDFVAFTGSVEGGHVVQRAASERFIATGLELGGKDPAYVRNDADLAHAVENLVDGAFFNSGQSCCGIERIYVHGAVYERFVEDFVETTRALRLGNPLDPETTLGPMVRSAAAEFVRGQVREATRAGAALAVDPTEFERNRPGTPYLGPAVLLGVDHSMRVMTEESFGPVVGIMKVRDDAEAVSLMNDSAYGLTAAVWTRDEAAALRIGEAIETGTFFMNRCDHLDPGLAWTGVKDSGRGCTLSKLGFEPLTRPKSFHLRTQT
jgi:acyl-CoA reductase-like NAD-dependent aldehyde dehydrogenase